MIKMRDGRHLRCVHNNPHGGSLPDYAPHPAIVLKMEDGSDLLLPIIVCMYLLITKEFRFTGFFSWNDIFKHYVSFSGDAECFVDGCSSKCSNSMGFLELFGFG